MTVLDQHHQDLAKAKPRRLRKSIMDKILDSDGETDIDVELDDDLPGVFAERVPDEELLSPEDYIAHRHMENLFSTREALQAQPRYDRYSHLPKTRIASEQECWSSPQLRQFPQHYLAGPHSRSSLRRSSNIDDVRRYPNNHPRHAPRRPRNSRHHNFLNHANRHLIPTWERDGHSSSFPFQASFVSDSSLTTVNKRPPFSARNQSQVARRNSSSRPTPSHGDLSRHGNRTEGGRIMSWPNRGLTRCNAWDAVAFQNYFGNGRDSCENSRGSVQGDVSDRATRGARRIMKWTAIMEDETECNRIASAKASHSRRVTWFDQVAVSSAVNELAREEEGSVVGRSMHGETQAGSCGTSL